jgi:hypothetical protein
MPYSGGNYSESHIGIWAKLEASPEFQSVDWMGLLQIKPGHWNTEYPVYT